MLFINKGRCCINMSIYEKKYHGWYQLKKNDNTDRKKNLLIFYFQIIVI